MATGASNGTSSGGRLQPPDLDDRRFDDLVAELRALARRKLPEWSDMGPSDPGMVVVEMVAWLVETLIFRLNRVTERNYVEFLNLIGVTRNPAVPATTDLTFVAGLDLTASLKVPAGTQVGTLPTESRASVVFETDEEVEISPLNLVEAYCGSPNAPESVTSNLVQPPLRGLRLDLEVNKTVSFYLGFEAKGPPPATTLPELKLRVGVGSVPIEGNGKPVPAKRAELRVSYAKRAAGASDKAEFTDDVELAEGSDGTEGFRRGGVLAVVNPAAWEAVSRWQWMGPLPEDERDADGQGNNRKLLWLRLNVTPADKRGLVLDYVLANSAPATNAVTYVAPPNARPDLIGNGTSNQFVELPHRPLYERLGTNPYDHVRVEVETASQRKLWSLVDDFPGDPAAEVFRLQAATGVIEFGDGVRGMAPPLDAKVFVTTYRYVAGGASGNVPPNTLTVPQRPLPAGVVRVFNPGSGRFGVDPEPIEDAKRRGPELLRNRSRAVTAEDFESLARKASARVLQARCLAPLEGPVAEAFFGRLDRWPGKVNVIIVPDIPAEREPTPPQDLVLEVQYDLARRAVITTGLTVTGPRFVPVKVTMTVQLFAARDGSPASQAVKERLRMDLDRTVRAFLHPVTGGPFGPTPGWPIGRHCFTAEIYDRVKDLIGGSGFVTQLEASTDVPDRQSGTGASIVTAPGWIRLKPSVGVGVADYELVCSAKEHSISIP